MKSAANFCPLKAALSAQDIKWVHYLQFGALIVIYADLRGWYRKQVKPQVCTQIFWEFCRWLLYLNDFHPSLFHIFPSHPLKLLSFSSSIIIIQLYIYIYILLSPFSVLYMCSGLATQVAYLTWELISRENLFSFSQEPLISYSSSPMGRTLWNFPIHIGIRQHF